MSLPLNKNNNQINQYSQNEHLSFKILWWYPLFSHPNKSRFIDFFSHLNQIQIQDQNQNDIQKNKYKKRPRQKKNMEISIDLIEKGIDKRTSLLIKNINTRMNKQEVIEWLLSLTKMDYIYVPEDDHTHKILGFAFVNVFFYKDIIDFIYKINSTSPIFLPKFKNFYYCNNLPNNDNNHFLNSAKKIGVCYLKKQGVPTLTKTFGESTYKI